MEEAFKLFAEWYGQVQKLGLKEPTAMNLATATSDGVPSSRIVLLKAWDERGFVFYTNANSRKGGELQSNGKACLNFYWMDLQKQVRIEGDVEKVTAQESDEYFSSRRLESRIGAWASKQSEVLPKREDLQKRIAEFGEKFGKNPPRPENWYGWRVKPRRIEYWQEGDFRLHQRDIFERDGKGWKHFQIYP